MLGFARSWINTYMDWILIGLIVLLIAVLFLMIVNTIRLNQIHNRYKKLMRGVQNGNLEDLLIRQNQIIDKLQLQVRDTVQDQKQLRDDVKRRIGPIGMVRYNAFHNTGSDLSFSIALLDDQGDGIVISSLYGREEQRTYGKPVINGASTYSLTEEEKEAISRAKQQIGKRDRELLGAAR